MRVIIIDDEDLARGVVREHLMSHPDVQVLAECRNGFDAVKAVTELKPDLIFLDVQMPKLNGFEVLELLESAPPVVFVTAYDTFALKAFDVHAVDYLLKPFSRERFEEAMGQARSRMRTGVQPELSALVADSRAKSAPLERILIRDGTNVHVIPVDSIDYFEAQDDYTSIHAAGKAHLKQVRLSDLESGLNPAHFVRIHRSTILNVNRLARIETYAKDSRVGVLKDGTKLLVSRAGYARLKEKL